MSSQSLQERDYEREARAYLAYLRKHHPEHFMEGIAQANQRKITLESFDWVKVLEACIHICNELLVQWARRGQEKPGQVVPDNMVVLSDQPLRASTSFNVPLEPAPPFWVFEYVSKSNPRKDHEDSFKKYEKELKVPYYLIFYPDTQDLTLYRHNKRKYVSVKPNEHGRYPVPELNMEVAILDGWVRFWYKGKLIPLPDQLQRDLTEARQQAEAAAKRADEEAKRADEEAKRADEEAKRADEATQQAEQEKRRADDLERQLAALQQELTRLHGRPGR